MTCVFCHQTHFFLDFYIDLLYIDTVYKDHLYNYNLYIMKQPSLDIPTLTKNCNETLILSILMDGKKHGYQLALEIEEKSNGLFKFNHGTLYPILHRLEKDKLIKGTWKQEGPKRQRKYYSLTAAGKKYVATQMTQWRTFYEQFFNIAGDVEP